MDDIEDWYRHLGALPISEWTPTGIDPRDTPFFNEVRNEIMKLGTIHATKLDWRLVVDRSVAILTDQSKDLQVACYLCRALADCHGYPGLAAGLAILRDMVAHYWETMFPEKKRAKARIAALDWLAESLYAFFEHRPPLPVDHRAVDRSLSALVDLEADLAVKLHQQAPPLGYLRRQLADYTRLMKIVHPLPVLAGPNPQPSAALHALMDEDRRSGEPVKTLDHVSSNRPSPPWVISLERLNRQKRLWKSIGTVAVLLLLASLGCGYYLIEIMPVSRIVAALEAQAGHFDDRSLALIASLPPADRARATRRFAADLAAYHLDRADAALALTDFVGAGEELEAARGADRGSPRAVRLAESLEAAPQKLLRDVKQDLSAAYDGLTGLARGPVQRDQAEALLRHLAQALADDDGRAAREFMARLAKILGDNGEVARQLERYVTLSIVQRSESLADAARYSKALQALSTGFVTAPQSVFLAMAKRRTETARSIYILRQAVTDRAPPDGLLIRQAFAQLRLDAPRQLTHLDEELRHIAETTAASWGVQDMAASRAWLQAVRQAAPADSRLAAAGETAL